MKTVTLQGEFQKFENLNQAISKFDEDRLPYKVKTRVYLIDAHKYDFDETFKNWDDEKFIAEAEIQGTIYTLKGFQKAFNLKEINSSSNIIRFINIII